ncbi:MAG: type II toxin-antitoxin system VapC family toxin [Spirosomataceae bacterium]
MGYLLDTHVLLWMLDNDSRLSVNAQTILADISINCFVSVISLYEMAIKKKTGKLSLSRNIEDYAKELQRIEITLLPITTSHLDTYEKVPLLNDHRDPFDRLLIATALYENLSIITADEKFALYNNTVKIVW